MPDLHQTIWVCDIALQIVVLFLLVWRQQQRTFPAIFIYFLLNLLQALAIYIAYKWNGFSSWAAFWTYWTSQSIVVVSRWLAVCELCRVILGEFKGIWGLTWRALTVAGLAALVCGISLAGHDYLKLVTTFDLGLEISMAVVLVVFFCFAKYYQIEIRSSLRTICIAFCLYSLFRALNDSFVQTLLRRYATTWGFVDEVTYFATLILIAGGVYALSSAASQKVILLPRTAYLHMSPRVNERLQLLNARLDQILRPDRAEKP